MHYAQKLHMAMHMRQLVRKHGEHYSSYLCLYYNIIIWRTDEVIAGGLMITYYVRIKYTSPVERDPLPTSDSETPR